MNSYRNYNRKSKNRGIFSYITIAIISGIIGGLIAIYISPNYLYGKILPILEVYIKDKSIKRYCSEIEQYKEDISLVTEIAKRKMSSVVGITTIVMEKEWLWERPSEGLGSGVIIDSDGYILTNSHVIGDGKAESIN